jgi:hypothetical protein
MLRNTLKGQCHEIFCFWFFFHQSVSPQPHSIPLGPFRIFSKIRGDTVFAIQGAPPVSTTPAANFASVVDTGGKFAADVVDTGSNFAAGVVDTNFIYLLILQPKDAKRNHKKFSD